MNDLDTVIIDDIPELGGSVTINTIKKVVKTTPITSSVNVETTANASTISDTTTKQLEQQRSGSCPVCGASRRREEHMRRFHDDIIDTLRSVTVVSLDSCILCVQKHVSRAMVYYEEMLTATDSGTPDGTASVNLKVNHLKVLGHLGCAIEESTEYRELNELLIKHERAYRYEGISPDWPLIATEIEKVEKSLEKLN